MNDSNGTDFDGPVAVGRFPTVLEANLAAGRLNAEGIETEVKPDAAHEIVGHTQSMSHSGGVAVLVPRSRSKKAAAVLQELQEERLAGDDTEDETADGPEGDEATLARLEEQQQELLEATGEIDIEKKTRPMITLSLFASSIGLAPLMLVRIGLLWWELHRLRDVVPEDARRRARGDLILAVIICLVFSLLPLALLLGILDHKRDWL